MPSLDPESRVNCFDEVNLGYSEEDALSEADRCLHCKTKPCVEGCPVGIDIPSFIARVQKKDYEGAYSVISASSSLPAVCGRVCPQETQCEGMCTRGRTQEPVGIGRLERFVADHHIKNSSPDAEKPESNGKRAAIIGSGPGGLTAAGELAKKGFEVTVFEALHEIGGVLVYGIPEFRLPKSVVAAEIEALKALGVKFETNTVIGKSLTIDELLTDEGFDAVYIGSGAGLPGFMGIPGENLNGVYSANEYLTRINLMKSYEAGSKTPVLHGKAVAVVGGGNVAMDAARCAKRLGAQTVYIIYRRSMTEMPARLEEIKHAMEEGVIMKTLCAPTELLSDDEGRVCCIRCVEMELGSPDASGRRRPIIREGSGFILEADVVIIAIGTSPNPLISSTTQGLETNRKGCIVTDEYGQTSREGVFAGGDAVTGAATVILAMGAGKKAAEKIDEYLNK